MWLLLSGDDYAVSGELACHRRPPDRIRVGCRVGTTCSDGPEDVHDLRRKSVVRRKCCVCGAMRSEGWHAAFFGRCSRCRLKVYCGVACQRYDWVVHGHKFACERWDDGEDKSKL